MMELLSNDGFIIVNKYIIKLLGLAEAIILGELCSEYGYWKKEDKLKNNYFYSTRENIEKNTGLSKHQQIKAIKTLVEKGIVLEKEIGMPSKKWYSISRDNLSRILLNIEEYETEEIPKNSVVKKLNDKSLNNSITCNEESKQHVVEKLNTNNNNIIINKNNNQSILSDINKKDMMDKIDYEHLFKSNIEYEIMIQDPNIRGAIEDITNVAVEILNSKKSQVKVNGELKNIEIVRSQLLKVKVNHIQYVINCLQKNCNDVKNITGYILTSLYNSVTTSNVDTILQVGRIMNYSKGCDLYE